MTPLLIWAWLKVLAAEVEESFLSHLVAALIPPPTPTKCWVPVPKWCACLPTCCVNLCHHDSLKVHLEGTMRTTRAWLPLETDHVLLELVWVRVLLLLVVSLLVSMSLQTS